MPQALLPLVPDGATPLRDKEVTKRHQTQESQGWLVPRYAAAVEIATAKAAAGKKFFYDPIPFHCFGEVKRNYRTFAGVNKACLSTLSAGLSDNQIPKSARLNFAPATVPFSLPFLFTMTPCCGR